MSSGAAGGNKKSNKGGQPKRHRYNAANRGYKRRLRDLLRHIEKHPNDKTAPDAVAKVRGLAAGGRP